MALQATIYRCHPNGRVEVLQVYVDDHNQSNVNVQVLPQQCTDTISV